MCCNDGTLLVEVFMPSLTVRNLPEETHRALRLRAARNGRSTEAEVRSILEITVLPVERVKFGTALYQISQKAGGLGDLEPLPRSGLTGTDFQ
jgi:plasmid stability protein